MIENSKKKLIIIIVLIVFLVIVSAIIAIVTLYPLKRDIPEKNENLVSEYNEENEQNNNVNDILSNDRNNIFDENVNENTNTNIIESNIQEEINTNTPKPKVTDDTYYIKVNNEANVVTVYKKDTQGKFNTPVRAMVCSIGDETPQSGTYKLTGYKREWNHLQGDVWGQYAVQIIGNILFHSVPYTEASKDKLEYWEYDKLGTKASLGCIRLKVEDVKWIYDNCPKGTVVEFYSDKNPGPLGKPPVKKISDDEEVRDWDPTDPDENNPWKEYLKNQTLEKAKKEQNIIEN